MNNHESAFDSEFCPKRLWVLTTLSDDEVIEDAGALPQGLTFHLTRCAPCRALAEQLLSVTTQLGTIRAYDPPDDFADRAESRVWSALNRGAELTGRVSIPNEEAEAPADRNSHSVWRHARFAAAAVIVLAAGLGGLMRSSTNNRQITLSPLTTITSQPSQDQALARVQRTAKNQAEASAADPKEAVAAKPAAVKINRFRSYEEAAQSEDRTAATAAVVLPNYRERDIDSSSPFDNQPRKVLTKPTRNDNCP